MRIYLDLDETLIGNVTDPSGNVIEIYPRPGAPWFIRTMSQHGDLWLLTAAAREHAKRALRKLGPEARRFKGIITREDLEPVEKQIDVVLGSPEISDDVRMELWDQIKPIAPPGVMFDDFPVGPNKMYAMKSRAIGINDDHWIQVDGYYPGLPDQQGLKRAYSEFLSRFGAQGLGRRGRMVLWR
jgi:NLI interacting factor-like phosphatase